MRRENSGAPIMSTISTQLRNFKEPTKEQLTEIFFSLPPAELSSTSNGGTPIEKLSNEEPDKMEINAVLSLGVQGEEDSYVSILLCSRLGALQQNSLQAGKLYILPPYLTFSSVDRKSVRFTIPLSTIRRVERLNARAGIYALSLGLWHGMKIVSRNSGSLYITRH